MFFQALFEIFKLLFPNIFIARSKVSSIPVITGQGFIFPIAVTFYLVHQIKLFVQVWRLIDLKQSSDV